MAKGRCPDSWMTFCAIATSFSLRMVKFKSDGQIVRRMDIYTAARRLCGVLESLGNKRSFHLEYSVCKLR